ncbi:MAG: hypothetical protein R3D68_01970 [Hyphomicrobiaceae bacterium]
MLTVFLAPGSLNHIANIVKGYAIAIGVAFAIWFVWQWWVKRQAEQRLLQAVKAKEAYAGFLEFATQHPKMAEPQLGAISGPVEIARYKQFVARLVATADQVLLLDPSEEWRRTIGRHLGAHASYLTSEEFANEGRDAATAEVRALIDALAPRM